MKLSPKQRALLARCAAGEDRQIPERLHEEPGHRPFVVSARRWFVPPGLLVTEGGGEAGAARALAAKGLLRHGGVPRSPELPYGLYGYVLTPKGKKALDAAK